MKPRERNPWPVRIFVDVTEPGPLFQSLRARAEPAGIPVQRTVLHKRPGQGAALRGHHPFYGMGADFLVVDDGLTPVAAIERKTLEDLTRSATVGKEQSRQLFRKVKDLLHHPMPILLLEGTPSPLYRRAEPMILGFQFWCAREGVSLIHALTPNASAHTVFLVARKLREELEAPPRQTPAAGRLDDLDELPTGREAPT